jgi:hypothetical protein
VDTEYIVLKRSWPSNQTSVHDQVNAHVSTHGYQAAQRVQSSD